VPSSKVASSHSEGQLAVNGSFRKKMPWKPVTRYEAGMNWLMSCAHSGSNVMGNVAPLRKSMGM
jgi:hypothetical protein